MRVTAIEVRKAGVDVFVSKLFGSDLIDSQEFETESEGWKWAKLRTSEINSTDLSSYQGALKKQDLD